MTGLLEGRVAIVTGAGRGIGRAHALELARHGAKVVVNDYGVSLAGEGTGESPADEVVALIARQGGEAVTNAADVADFAAAAAMVQQAIDTFGGLDILVNNAGFVRDRMLVNTSEEEWDAVIRVHLKGHFAPLRHAGAYWRAESKEGRERAGPGDQHVVRCRPPGLGRAGDVLRGQGRHRRPDARGRPGAGPLRRHRQRDRPGRPDPDDRGCLRHLARWRARGQLTDRGLARLDDAADVTGRVIEIEGGTITVETGWPHGPRRDAGARWDAADVGPALRDLLAQAPAPEPVYGA